MGLKTFNINEEAYKEFSAHCKKNGISMSKKIENFILEELDVIKSGGRVARSRIVRDVRDLIGDKEHSFKKYC